MDAIVSAEISRCPVLRCRCSIVNTCPGEHLRHFKSVRLGLLEQPNPFLPEADLPPQQNKGEENAIK